MGCLSFNSLERQSYISIHASVKEATFFLFCFFRFLMISIHASMKEATITILWSNILKTISIHASMKEATPDNFVLSHPPVFQSTPPWRRRRRWELDEDAYSIFQPTPPWRRRLQFPPERRNVRYFNPRLHEGGDIMLSWVTASPIKFQSTPPWRRRHRSTFHNIIYLIDFNPRLHEGGDYIRLNACGTIRISIHASMKEATVVSVESSVVLPDFNPRLHEGGDVSLFPSII